MLDVGILGHAFATEFDELVVNDANVASLARQERPSTVLRLLIAGELFHSARDAGGAAQEFRRRTPIGREGIGPSVRD